MNTEKYSEGKWIRRNGVIYSAFLLDDGRTIVSATLTGEVFNHNQALRVTPNIYAEAASRGLEVLGRDIDMAKLFAHNFQRKEIREGMCLYFVAMMHELVDYEGKLPKVDAWRPGDNLEISSVQALPSGQWDIDCGNTFIARETMYPLLKKWGLRFP